MPLDPQAQAYLDQMAALNAPPLHTLTPELIRQATSMQRAMLGEPEPVANVENRLIPGPASDIPIRIYTPSGNGPFPVLVFFHGGGWVICDLDTHDDICRSLTNQAACIVVSVDYRLAPEHKFPAAPEDCYTATQWVAGHAAELNAHPGKLAIGGDSAGGNLTAVVAQMARDQGGLSLVGFSSSRLLSCMSVGLGVLLFRNRRPRGPWFRHEAAHHQPITSDQPPDDGDDATRKTTQHAWARTSRGGATGHMGLGQGLQTADGQGRINLASHAYRPQRRHCDG